MKIHQMLPNYWYGDAIGNNASAIREKLMELGYESEIYTELVHPKLTARSYTDFLEENSRDTWVIYHYSTGSPVNRFALENLDNIILIYHNITPGEYFARFDEDAAIRCDEGRETLARFASVVKASVGDSEYNAMELARLGFHNPAVSPLILDTSVIEPSGVSPFNDEKTNILFVGRVAPNKRHEDLIKVFYYYKNFVNENSRLVMVGGYDVEGGYYRSLENMARVMDLPDVVFTGVAPNERLGDYFSSADVFLCLSRHEGFCVPLIEAMRFGIPIVALSTTAVPYTLGPSGIVVERMEPHAIAEIIGEVCDNKKLRNDIVEGQYRRLEEFAPEKATETLFSIITETVKGVTA